MLVRLGRSLDSSVRPCAEANPFSLQIRLARVRKLALELDRDPSFELPPHPPPVLTRAMARQAATVRQPIWRQGLFPVNREPPRKLAVRAPKSPSRAPSRSVRQSCRVTE